MSSKTFTPAELMQMISEQIDKIPPELLNKGIKLAIMENKKKTERKHPDSQIVIMTQDFEKKTKEQREQEREGKVPF
jgi:hypothetical protein